MDEAITTDLASLRSDYDALQQHAADVAERHDAARLILEQELEEIRDKWAETNSELLDEYADITTRAGAAEKALREAIIAAYNATNEKKFGHGLSVRVGTKFVYDEAAAIEWAATNAPICVKRVIDKKAFEAICKTSQPEFVRVEETPVAVIGK